MFFDTYAKIMTNPSLLGERSKRCEERGGGVWVVAALENDLGNYLRYLYKDSFYKTKELVKPAWGDHITIVRNEICGIFNAVKWTDVRAQVRVWMEPRTNGYYWWLPAESEAMRNLRSDLGLSREPEIPFHLSFGHTGEKELTAPLSPAKLT